MGDEPKPAPTVPGSFPGGYMQYTGTGALKGGGKVTRTWIPLGKSKP